MPTRRSTSVRGCRFNATQQGLCSIRSWRRIWRPVFLSILSLCLLGTGSSAVATLPSTSTGSAPQGTHTENDGFTRDSMATLDQPQATPVPTGSLPSLPPTPSKVNSTRALFQRRQAQSSRSAHTKSHVSQPPVVSKKPRPRNAVARFVYWWNGMIITAFHTKFGTVLYGTIGADTSRLPSRG